MQEEAEMGKVCIETCDIDDLFMSRLLPLLVLRSPFVATPTEADAIMSICLQLH